MDVIKEVGPGGGGFLMNEHTLRNFKNEVWYPGFLYKSLLNKEEKILEYANAKYETALKNYVKPDLETDKERERVKKN